MNCTKKAKRIFAIADFYDESVKSIRLPSRMWVKGFLRLGHDVQRFSYRNVLAQFNPFSGKHFRRFMPNFVRRRADELLVKQIKAYQPEIVFVNTMKYITADSIVAAREAAPNAIFVGRDDGASPERNKKQLSITSETDIVVATGGQEYLRVYKNVGVPLCAFMPNASDPDIQYRYDVDEKWKTDIIFTGKAEHRRLGDVAPDRYRLVSKLSKLDNARVYGAFGVDRVAGLDCFHAISGARIGLSINITNDVSMYHSDRLINYLSCGTCVLSKRVPDSDLLFKDGLHLKYFDTVEEFFELADWYLAHEDEREKIATAGMERAHSEFNCTKIASCMMDIIEKGKCDEPWNYVI